MTYLVADIETTITQSFKRKANPFDAANWVVLAGWSGPSFPANCKRYGQSNQSHEWLVHFLRDPSSTLLVGQNIKFDLLHLLKDPEVLEAWMAYVARGGNVWDVQLAEYLLDGQQQASHMLSLDELAERYGGDLKVDEVKVLWAAGVPTQEIDPDLLKRYLMGEVLPNGERREGDIGNTELVFKKQLAKARATGQVRSILLNMGSLLATTEMERNGMFVDKELGLKLAADLEKRLEAARERLQEYLPQDLPFDFSWTNRYHLSPLVFGGRIRYDRRQYDLKDGSTTWEPPPEVGGSAYAYTQMDVLMCTVSDLCKNDGFPPGSLLSVKTARDLMIPVVRYASGKNAGEVKTKKVKVDDYTKPKSRMADCFLEFPGYTEPEPEWASSTEGLYSVAAEIIDALGNRNIPFLKDLASVKKMEKDLSTYYITWNEKKQEYVGMLTLVQPDSIIHHSLNHTSTVTGRFSSSNPNLQNIPKGNKSEVKTVFKSRYPDGSILQSDFSSLEVYIQAILTGSKNLIADLKKGLDLHCVRLAAKEHMEYEEVLKLAKGWKETAADGSVVHHAAVEEWDYKRTGAKVFSFQRAYGAGVKTIAAATGMPVEEVELLVKAEQERYPEIDAYFEERTKEIQGSRIPIDRYIQHPEMPALRVQLGLGRVTTPDGKVYAYNESPSPAFVIRRGGAHAGFSPTEIKNYEVQGEGGEWMKAALWLLVREFYRTGNMGGLALLVNTVHDAAYADSHPSVREQAGQLMQACMEAASDFMEWWFSWDLPLPVPTDTVHGKDMGDEQPFNDPSFRPTVRAMREDIRTRLIGGYTPSYEKE